MRRLLALLTVLAALPGAVPAHAATDGHGLGIRLVDAPSDRRDDPRAHLYVVDHVRPGAVVTRRVEVSNDTGQATVLSTYAAPADLRDDTFVIGDPGTANELTGWTTVSPAQVQLAPRGTATVTLRIAVPSDAGPGERYGAVVAAAPAVPVPGSGLAVASRVGVRLYLDVGPGGEPVSDFSVSTLTAARSADGTPVVTARVTNTGGRALDLSGELALDEGPGGLRAGPFPVEQVTTLGVGASGTVRVALDRALPSGPWQATMTLRSGRVERRAVGTLDFPVAGVTAAPVAARTLPGLAVARDRGVVVPVAVGVLVLAALLLAIALWLRRRPRRTRRERPAADEPTDLPIAA